MRQSEVVQGEILQLSEGENEIERERAREEMYRKTQTLKRIN